MKSYDVYFQGKQSIEAENEDEARDMVYERLKKADLDMFDCREVEEIK